MVQAGDRALIALRLRQWQAFNASRIAQAAAVMPFNVRRFFNLLPLYLHFNHPYIPGYRDAEVPCGIDGFKPDAQQQQELDRLCPNFCPLQRGKPAILALYAMGSTSSLGQGIKSDLDIWVCVDHNLSADLMRRLNEKCRFICTLAAARGVELNLFVTPDDRFIQAAHGLLDSDNCGSAQNIFLLDEFYRTAIRMCGRGLIWYLVSNEEERRGYKQRVEQILSSGALNPNEWFDFGSVLTGSPAEYFGSGLWMLYKAIDAPFKAVLKILLMECYSAEYPHTALLSSQLKERMQKNPRISLHLDSYCLILQKVSAYLQANHDEERLRLARGCFYLKLFQALQGLSSGRELRRRTTLLKVFYRSWGWSDAEARALGRQENWKIEQVQELNQVLFSSLIKSYRALLRFSVQHGIEAAITSDDAGILSRKLYAAYDRYPGKVIVLNSELCAALEERYLTMICPDVNSVCRQGWYIFPCESGSLKLLSLKPAYIARHLSEAVTWACFNRLLMPRTQVQAAGHCGIVNAVKIKRLAGDIMRLIYPHIKDKSSQNLQRPREIQAGCAVINLTYDLTLDHGSASLDLDSGSSLSCGRQHICLVGSIDLIFLNTWGEVRVISMPPGEEGIVELLATLLRLSRRRTQDSLRGISVCCYAHRHQDLLRYDLEALIRKIFICQESGGKVNFEVGRHSYTAGLNINGEITIHRRRMFRTDDFDISILSRYGMRPEFALQVPPIVDRYANLGVIQYFFAPTGINHCFDIYILNERNEVAIHKNYVGSRSELVNAINRFYARQSEEVSHLNTHFNLPQYFVLSKDLKRLHPFTIRGF